MGDLNSEIEVNGHNPLIMPSASNVPREFNAVNPYRPPSASEFHGRFGIGKVLTRAGSFCAAICLTFFTAMILSVGLPEAITAIGDPNFVLNLPTILVVTCIPYIACTKAPQSNSIVTYALRPAIAGFFTVAVPIGFCILFPSLNSAFYRSIAAIDLAAPLVSIIIAAVQSFGGVLVVICFPILCDKVRKRMIANA